MKNRTIVRKHRIEESSLNVRSVKGVSAFPFLNGRGFQPPQNRTNTDKNTQQCLHILQDILILQVSGPGISSFQLINIYNEKGLGENQEWTIKRSLETIKPEKRSIIYGDFNAHYRWWNLRISNLIRYSELIP